MIHSKPVRLLAAVAMLVGTTAAQAFVIDGFTTNQIVTAGPGNRTVTDNLPSSGSTTFVGTNRRVTVSNTDGSTTANINQLRPDILDLSNTGTASGTVTLLYTGIGGVDFTEGSTNTGLYLGLPSRIDHPMTIAFDVNNGSTFQRTFLDGSEGNRFFFPFSSFSNAGAFGSVDSLLMSLSSSRDGWDASIDTLETRPSVPIPGTLALLALGLGGLRLRHGNR